MEEAATLAAGGSYKNSGQRCTAVKRMLVHESVADRFVELLVAKTQEVKYGDPLDPATDMGTVIDEAAAIQFESVVDAAIAGGARLLAGHKRDGALYALPCSTTWTRKWPWSGTRPWPCLAGHPLQGYRRRIRISNGTAYGLSSSVCTNRLDYITRFIRELHVGTVNVREVPGYRLEMTPFGGIKDSGLGYKEGVLEAMKSFCNTKTYSLPW